MRNQGIPFLNKRAHIVFICNNIKSHKKTGLHPRSEKCIFGKTIGRGRGGQLDHSPPPQSF